MTGYDYVINSRVGLPIERALRTVSVDGASAQIQSIYKNYLKTVVANVWQGEPHTYAIKVMYDYAYNQGING